MRRKGIWRYHQPKTLCKWYAETYDDQTKVDEVNARMEKYAKENPKYKHVPTRLGDRQHPWDRCKYRLPDFFDDRNYLKFAILGNVRNGYGFAGVKTFDELPPMSDCRGVPADISPEAKAKLSNEHSPTWVTLAEMMAYDFGGNLVHEGVISELQFLECLVRGENPKSWSGGISGAGIVTVTPEQYLALFGQEQEWYPQKQDAKPKTYNLNTRYHISHRWQEPLATAPHQIPEIITYMHDLIPRGGSAEDVRLVCDFDS